MSTHLGKISFLDTPDVNGDLVLTSTTGVAAGGVTGTANAITVTGTTSPIIDIADNPIIGGTAGISIPSGTTAQRSGTPSIGTLRFNTSLGITEIYTGSPWVPEGKVLQSVAGSVGSFSTTAVPPKTSTSIPLTTDGGVTIFTQAFTPISASSSIVVQFALTGYLAVSGRAMYSAVFAGSTCIGMTTVSTPAVGGILGIGTVPLTMQCVYQPGNTTAIIFTGRVGHLNGTAGNTTTVGVNNVGTSGNYGGAANTEYRILEILS